MLTIKASNIAQLYKEALERVMYAGKITYPRGFVCKELTPVTMVLSNPEKNILNDSVRKINKAFAAAEFLWIYNGHDDVESISKFNSKIAEYSDDGIKFFGAYGPRFRDQFTNVIETLENDEWSRQAVMTFWRQNPPKTKDVPCTVMLHFIRRPINTLNLIVYMRSNDVWLGLPYDVHNFTCIQIIAASILKIKVGTYTQIDGSLHAYEKDFEKINNCILNLEDNMYEESDKKYTNLLLEKYKVKNDYLNRKNK